MRFVFTLAVMSSLGLAWCADDVDSTPMVTISGTLVDAMSSDPIVGATICFDEPAGVECATTDAAGAAALTVRANRLIKARITAAGYLPVLTFGNTEEDDIVGIRIAILSTAAADLALGAIGVTRDDTKGSLLFATATDVTLATKVADVSVTTTATTGTAFYASSAGIPDTTLTATTEGGAGGVANIDPGTYEASFSHGSKTCVDGFAWPTSNQGAAGVTVQLPIEAGVLTFLAAYCN